MPRPNVEAERKAQILQATCRVIAARGARELRLTDVAHEAGLSSGTIHYYFETKRDVMHAAFEYNFRHSLERRTDLLRSGTDPLTLLGRVVDSYLPEDTTRTQAWRVWAELWTDGLHEPELRDLNEAIYGEWRSIVAALIRDAQDQGLIVEADPVGLANTIVSMIDGMAIQVLLGSRNMTLEKMRRTLHQYLDGISTGARSSESTPAESSA